MAQLCKWFMVVWTIICLIWLITGLGGASEQYDQAESDAEKAGTAVGTTIGVGIIALAWFIPTVGAGMMYLVFRKPDKK